MKRSVCLYVEEKWVHGVGIAKPWIEMSANEQLIVKQIAATTRVLSDNPDQCPCKLHCRAVGWSEADLLINGATVVESSIQPGKQYRL